MTSERGKHATPNDGHSSSLRNERGARQSPAAWWTSPGLNPTRFLVRRKKYIAITAVVHSEALHTAHIIIIASLPGFG